jgi:uncharacterized membrane protein
MPDSDTLASIASIIAGFGVAMLFFRIQRELQMHKEGETIWIPHADWLLISATLVSLLLVILPLIAFDPSSSLQTRLPTAACAASALMVAGYIFGILAHYRLIFGKKRSGPRENPEPAERLLVFATVVMAGATFSIILLNK